MSIEKIVDSAKNFIKKHRKFLVAAASMAAIGYSAPRLVYAVKNHPDVIKMMSANMLGKTIYHDIQINYAPEYGIKTIVTRNMPLLSEIDKRYKAVTECLGLDAEANKGSFEILIYGEGRKDPVSSSKDNKLDTFGYAFYSPVDRSRVLVVNGDLSALGHELVHHLANVVGEDSELLSKCGDTIDNAMQRRF